MNNSIKAIAALVLVAATPRVTWACCCDDPTGSQEVIDLCDSMTHTATITGCHPEELYSFGGPEYVGQTITFSPICDGTIGSPAYSVWTINPYNMLVCQFEPCDVGAFEFTIPTEETFYLRASVAESNGVHKFKHNLLCNHPPDCAEAYADPDRLWPPNHKMTEIKIVGVTDEDDDSVSIKVNYILQNEVVDAKGSGQTDPDAEGVDTDTAMLRNERSGKGDGRLYKIGYTADDGNGGACFGDALVCVPKSQKAICPPAAAADWYDSTQERIRLLRH